MPQLDAIRAFAVCAVMINHFVPETARFVDLGLLGVDLFFVLSGFLITGILLRARRIQEANGGSIGFTLRHFYIRRFLRILPLSYFVILATALFGVFRSREMLFWNLTYLTNIHIFLISNWPPAFSHFWSLSVEEQFYLLWPLLVLRAPWRYLEPLMIGIVALAPITKIAGTLAGAHPLFIRLLPTSCLDMLGIGALLALATQAGSETRLSAARIKKGGVLLGLPLLTIALVLRQLLPPRDLLMNTVNDAATALVCVAIVGRAADGFKGWIGNLLESRPLTYIGRISYGIYVYHLFMPSLMLRVERYMSAPMPRWLNVLACFGATIAAAAISWRLLERPFNQLKHHFAYEENPNSGPYTRQEKEGENAEAPKGTVAGANAVSSKLSAP